MRYLYIFPHPDDESFGPAIAISRQIRDGNEVHLLTLTKGEATKQRKKYGYSREEMGEVRHREMKEVSKVLRLTSLKVLDFPDGNLAEIDPRLLEAEVARQIKNINPDIIVSYPVHGISGFEDHLVMHAIIKRVFCDLMENENGAINLKRLAFFTLGEERKDSYFPLKISPAKRIDCIMDVEREDVERMGKALDCYKTYQEVIDAVGIRNYFQDKVFFEIFNEMYDPVLKDLGDNLPV